MREAIREGGEEAARRGGRSARQRAAQQRLASPLTTMRTSRPDRRPPRPRSGQRAPLGGVPLGAPPPRAGSAWPPRTPLRGGSRMWPAALAQAQRPFGLQPLAEGAPRARSWCFSGSGSSAATPHRPWLLRAVLLRPWALKPWLLRPWLQAWLRRPWTPRAVAPAVAPRAVAPQAVAPRAVAPQAGLAGRGSGGRGSAGRGSAGRGLRGPCAQGRAPRQASARTVRPRRRGEDRTSLSGERRCSRLTPMAARWSPFDRGIHAGAAHRTCSGGHALAARRPAPTADGATLQSLLGPAFSVGILARDGHAGRTLAPAY